MRFDWENPLTEWERLLALLMCADKREIPVTVVRAPNFGNYPTYYVGFYRIEVFDDAGDWDYIESVTFPDGRKVEYGDLPNAIRQWGPDNLSVWGYKE